MANFSTFDPYAGYDNSKHIHNCTCIQGAMPAGADEAYRDRLRAAVCRCGFVGAECFNDSYCEDVPVMTTTEQLLCKYEQDVAYWRALYDEAIEQIARRNDTINDLQAEYAQDVATNDSATEYQVDYINQLETTIRVLSGMIG